MLVFLIGAFATFFIALTVTIIWMVIELFFPLPFSGQLGELKFRRSVFWAVVAFLLVGWIVGACELA